MIIPSIDIMDGQAVQLRQGKEKVLDGGDPFERLEEFSVVGDVAVIDLDAAMGTGSNRDLIRRMVKRARCRVGGGIRDVETAREWIDAGAEKVIIGTAASVEFCQQLPRTKAMAAVDAVGGDVVVEGWKTKTGRNVLDLIRELQPVVSSFLFTQVEHEGELGGFDRDLVAQALEAAGDATLTAAGGVTTLEDIAWLHQRGVDAQVGMAIYTGRMSLGAAVGACLTKPIDERFWPTVVCDEQRRALGLVWSTRDSVEAAVTERKGIYWSRSRNELWRKGATSGATQSLQHVELDCDSDALRFVVEQAGPGFCHTGTRSCFGADWSTTNIEKMVERRLQAPEPQSGTTKLLNDPTLLKSKLEEEAQELAQVKNRDDAIHEAADVLYFTLVQLRKYGGSLRDVERELERRDGRTHRRPMEKKPEASA